MLQKYADDQGGYHAATIAYYGFFAIFPLLLVLTTALGFVLQSHPHLEQRIIDSALGQFPVIGPQLSHGSLHGRTLALVLNLAAALWAGMGVFLASQNAMNHLWGVPFKRRPDPLHARGRALLLLALLGGGALAATILAALATVGARFGLTWKIRLARALDRAQHRPLLARLPPPDRPRSAGGNCAAVQPPAASSTSSCKHSAATTSATPSSRQTTSTAPSAS